MRGRASGGICPCTGIYEQRAVDVTIARQPGPGPEPEPLTLAALPQQVCPICGSRVYPAPVLSRIEAAWHRSRRA